MALSDESLSSLDEAGYDAPLSDADSHSSNSSDGRENNEENDECRKQAAVFALLLKQKSSKSDVVLARRLKLLQAPDEAALDRRAHAILRGERRTVLSALRKKPRAETGLVPERILRKMATKGVVQMFNAVHRHQTLRDQNNTRIVRKPKNAPFEPERKTKMEDPSFMDFIKSGPARIL